MPFTAAVRESASLSITGLGAWISLHTADPGTTGASEATGGSPAYARKQTTWTGGGSDGAVTGSQVTIDVPTGTYTHAGLWTAQSGGTFIGRLDLGGSVVMSSQGPVEVTPSVTST